MASHAERLKPSDNRIRVSDQPAGVISLASRNHLRAGPADHPLYSSMAFFYAGIALPAASRGLAFLVPPLVIAREIDACQHGIDWLDQPRIRIDIKWKPVSIENLVYGKGAVPGLRRHRHARKPISSGSSAMTIAT